MSIFCSDRLAGVKLGGGVNIIPRADDLSSPVGSAWYQLSYQWATGHASDPWTRWLQPQIDAAYAQGCNGCRFFFSAELLKGDTIPHIATVQFQTIMAQMANYLAAYGMWFYPCCADSSDINEAHNTYNATTGDIQDYMTACVGYLSAFPNVWAFDLSQEVNGVGGWSQTNMGLWFTSAKAARVLAQPVTCSLSGLTSLNSGSWAAFQAVIDAGGEFADFHCYGTMTSSDIGYLTYNGGSGVQGANDIPVLVGEVGIQNSEGSTAITNRYNMMVAWSLDPRIQAVCVWAMVDFGGANDWGVYADTQNGSYVFTAPRTPQTTLVQTMAKTIQPYNVILDAFAVTHAPPTQTARSATTVSLSWAAATGGSGTITYTPQYVPIDSNGFPLAAWSSGTPTTSTSSTLSGLATGRYACRIRTSGAPEGGGSTGVTYSSWLEVPARRAFIFRRL